MSSTHVFGVIVFLFLSCRHQDKEDRKTSDEKVQRDSNLKTESLNADFFPTTEKQRSFYQQASGETKQAFATYTDEMEGKEATTESDKILEKSAFHINAMSEEKIAEALESEEYDELKQEIEEKEKDKKIIGKDQSLILGASLIGVGLMGPEIWRWSIYQKNKLVFDPYELLQKKFDEMSRRQTIYYSRKTFYSDAELDFESAPFKVQGVWVLPENLSKNLLDEIKNKIPDQKNPHFEELRRIIGYERWSGTVDKYAKWIEAKGGFENINKRDTLLSPDNEVDPRLTKDYGVFDSENILSKQPSADDGNNLKFKSLDEFFKSLPDDNLAVTIYKKRYIEFTKQIGIKFGDDGISTETISEIENRLKISFDESRVVFQATASQIYEDMKLKRFTEGDFINPDGTFKDPKKIEEKVRGDYEKFLKHFPMIKVGVTSGKSFNYGLKAQKPYDLKSPSVKDYVKARNDFHVKTKLWSLVGKISGVAGVVGVISGFSVIATGQLGLAQETKTMSPADRLITELSRIAKRIDVYKRINPQAAKRS